MRIRYRDVLEDLLSVVAVAVGGLSVLKLITIVGFVWSPPLDAIAKLGDVPGLLLEDMLELVGLELPNWANAVFSFYVLMGGYFSWITYRIGRRMVDRSTIEMGSRYVLAVVQEAAIMVLIWPWRLASDCKKRIYFRLSPIYVVTLFAAAALLFALALAFHLVRYSPNGAPQ
jgi:hypothetical protein